MRYVFLFLFLVACGLKPIYSNIANTEVSNIHIQLIPQRIGQIMYNALSSRMGYESQDYDKILSVKMSTSISNLGIESDATYSVSEVTVNAEFSLTQRGTAKVLDNFIISRSSTFTTTLDSSFAHESSKDKAQQNAIEAIAEIAHDRLIAKLTQ